VLPFLARIRFTRRACRRVADTGRILRGNVAPGLVVDSTGEPQFTE
jgi:hypothetical protein